jgi:peptide/nickel transport system substrate-binding protein
VITALLLLVWTVAQAQNAPEGQLTIAFDTTIAPSYLDPAEVAGLATPFTFLYALHDAMIKPLPGNNMAPCLAESWTESADGLVYEFTLRQGVRFHNGDPFTAADVQFTFERYKGTSAKILHERVKAVEIVDPHHVRFVLQTPWPDFLTFYGSLATGSGWFVPKKYLEQVGDDGFKQRPVGLGPYRFVSGTPGVELTLEANEQYWRKKPSIKRIVFKGVPERSTRLAMLKTGEADIGYLMIGDEAVAIQSDPKLRLAQVISAATWWLEFPEQWNEKSPARRRVRPAANLASIRRLLTRQSGWGCPRLTGSIIPSTLGFMLPLHPIGATQIKPNAPAEAGYPSGFDAGESHRPLPLPPLLSLLVTILGRWAFACVCARWSAPPSSLPGVTKSCKALLPAPRQL